jgi:hypothetical protein
MNFLQVMWWSPVKYKVLVNSSQAWDLLQGHHYSTLEENPMVSSSWTGFMKPVDERKLFQV